MLCRMVEVCVFRKRLAIITEQTFELGKVIPKTEKKFGWKELYVNDNVTDYFRDLLIRYGWRVSDKRV